MMMADVEVRGQSSAAWEIARVRKCLSGCAMGGPWLSSADAGLVPLVTALCAGLDHSDNSVALNQS